MNRDLIFVTGLLGAPIEKEARKIADKKGFGLLSLDQEIQRDAGSSVQRLCMLMGEHEYRNREYKALQRIAEQHSGGGLVVFCGDGVLLDEMSRELIQKHTVFIVGEDMDNDALWRNASGKKDSWHAFLYFGTQQERRQAFDALIQRQRRLYETELRRET